MTSAALSEGSALRADEWSWISPTQVFSQAYLRHMSTSPTGGFNVVSVVSEGLLKGEETWQTKLSL